MKKKLLCICFTLFIVSCGSNIESNTIQISQTQKDSQELTYDKSENKLHIGKNVEISQNKTLTLPQGITIYNNVETYDNSNRKNYLFFVVDKNEDINKIAKYYRDLFTKLGYKNIGERTIKNPNLQRLNYQHEEKVDPLKDNIKLEDIQPITTISMKIAVETPENIKTGMGLEGIFVEISHNTY